MKYISTRMAGLLLASLAVLNAGEKKDRMNVLFISIDDLRPEMGCYGNSVIKTPNFDRLAARGIVFNKAYCCLLYTSPSPRDRG